MNILNKLTRKHLLLNKKRTVSTLIGIILSCALICGVTALMLSFQQFLIDSTIKNSGPQHVEIKNVNEDDLKYIEKDPYVKESFISNYIGYSKYDSNNKEYYNYIKVTGYDKYKLSNSGVHLKSGRLPVNDNEIILTSTIIELLGNDFKLGDKIKLNIGQRYLDDQLLTDSDPYTDGEIIKVKIEKEYTLVGIMESDPEYSRYNIYYTGITLLNEEVTTNNLLNVSVVTKDPKNVYKFGDNIKNTLKLNKGDIVYNNELLRFYGVTKNDGLKSIMFGVSAVLIGLILVASVSVIYSAFTISITERKKLFGMLRGIGTTKKQIKSLVLYEGFILGIIAIPLGIIFGFLGIGITLMIINNLLDLSAFGLDGFRLVISLEAILISIGISVVTILLSLYIPMKRASRITPIQAIKQSDDIKISNKKLKTNKLVKKLFGIEGEIALKNSKRSKKKYRITTFAITISIILFISVSYFITYMKSSLNEVYKTTPYEFSLNGYNLNKEKQDKYNKILEDVKGFGNTKESILIKTSRIRILIDKSKLNNEFLSDIESSGLLNESSSSNMVEVDVMINTIDDEYFNDYLKKLNLNRLDYEKNNLSIVSNRTKVYSNNKIKEVNLFKDNSSLNVDLINPENNTKVGELTLSKFTDLLPNNIFKQSNYLSFNIFVSNQIYDELVKKYDSETLNTSISYYIKSNNYEQVSKMSKEYFENNTTSDIDFMNLKEDFEYTNNLMFVISILFYGFITIIILVGITNIFNTVTTNISLRRREFAMLQSIGLTKKGLNKIVYFESIFLGIKSLFYGLIIGTGITYLIYKFFSEGVDYGYKLPIGSYIITIIGVILIIYLIMMYSISKIKSANIIDSIKDENI